MNCKNFLCENYTIKYGSNCCSWINVKSCESRKTFNRILRAGEKIPAKSEYLSRSAFIGKKFLVEMEKAK